MDGTHGRELWAIQLPTTSEPPISDSDQVSTTPTTQPSVNISSTPTTVAPIVRNSLPKTGTDFLMWPWVFIITGGSALLFTRKVFVNRT